MFLFHSTAEPREKSLGDEVFSQGWSPRSNATLQLGCEPTTWSFFFLKVNPTIEKRVPWNFFMVTNPSLNNSPYGKNQAFKQIVFSIPKVRSSQSQLLRHWGAFDLGATRALRDPVDPPAVPTADSHGRMALHGTLWEG